MSNTSKCRKRFSELLKYKNGGRWWFSPPGLMSDGEFNDNVYAAYRVVQEMKEYKELNRRQKDALWEFVMDHKR